MDRFARVEGLSFYCHGGFPFLAPIISIVFIRHAAAARRRDYPALLIYNHSIMEMLSIGIETFNQSASL